MKQDATSTKENLIKKTVSNKMFLSLLFFTMGVGADWAVHQYRDPVARKNSELRRLITENITDFDDPAEDALLKKMLRPRSPFWPDLSGVRQHEDDRYVYYDIDLKNFDPQKIDVRVNERTVSVSGQAEHKEEADGLNRYSSSSFQRSFPVPENADPRTYKMERENGKIILKFSKTGKTENT